MQNRALLSAVALCFLVAGCESKKDQPAKPIVADKVVPVPASGNPDPMKAKEVAAPQGCTQGNCKVWLDVTGTEDPTCKIIKQPDYLYVWQGNQNDTIRFMLRTNEWSFDANGISFASGGITCTADTNPKKYNCQNPNLPANAGKHDYVVRLKHSSGKKCTQDPSVVNGVADAQVTAMQEPAAM